MFANVFTKSTRDNLPAGLFGALALAFFLFFAMWVYRDVDTSFYFDLPAGILELVGINPDGEGTGAIAFGSIYNLMGAFTVAGLALSWGASAIAGEERDGTLGFLLGNPVSRRAVLVSKTVAMVLIVALMSLILWGLGIASAEILEVSTEGLFVGAITFAMFVNSLFYGFMALAIGAWVGRRSVASGAAAGLMIVGYLAANLLPLADLEWLARLFPWYYFSSSAPINNGLDWGHVSVLIGLSAALFVVAFVGVQRRDLREKGTDITLLDRLRSHPMTEKMTERLAGSTRVSRIATKTLSEHQGLFTITAAVMFYMGVLIPPLYSLIPEDFVEIFASFPDALVAMIGGVDMGTPSGFLTGEVFALVGPISIIVLCASIGARALAGEEENRTMGLLLSNPVTRGHVVREKSLAMVGYAVGFGIVTFLGTWLGVWLGGLDDVGIDGIAAISILLTLFGLVFGGVALALSAATGKRSRATMGTTGIAVAAWFAFSFFPLSESFEPFTILSPFQWYLGSDPLLNGMDWAGASLLIGTFIGLVALSHLLFQKRDLRG